MKADVFPADIPPKLEIPFWVPDVIAQHVSAKYAAAVDRVYETALRENGDFEDEDDMPREYLDRIIRDDVVLREHLADLIRDELADITERYLPLVCDRRMERVWRELSRQRNGVFLHPALSSMATAKERQDTAMLELFDKVLACQERRWATTTKSQTEQQRNFYLAKAAELEDDAIEMLLQPMLFCGWDAVSKCGERYQKLKDAAQACRDYANEIYATNFPIALERKHDSRARWVTLTIGDTFRTLFGSPMYGLTTTITSVVLGREIELRTVRQWLQTVA